MYSEKVASLRLHLKHCALGSDSGDGNQPLDAFHGQADGAFNVDKIGGAAVVENIALGWKLIIAVPEQETQWDAGEGIELVADLGMTDPDTSEAFTGRGEFFRLATEGFGKGGHYVFFKCCGKW